MTRFSALAVLLAATLLVPAGHIGRVQAAQPTASAARLGVEGKRTRFVMEIDRKVDIRVFTLADPYRVIIDLPQVVFQLPAGTGQHGRGLVSAYRYGLLAVGRSRVVLDVTQPVAIEQARLLPEEGGGSARLVVDLVGTTREAFMQSRANANYNPPRTATQTAAAAMPMLRPQVNEKPVVVIDPGHGGIDPGAISEDGVNEKDLVLAFGLALRDAIMKIGCCGVRMTRDNDIFLALRERVALARNKGAALFISLHADKFRGGGVRGATVYTLSEKASDAEAAALAKAENKADLIAGLDLDDEPDEVTDILIDLAQRETKNFSVHFAKTLVKSMRREVKLNKNPHRFAGFTVLRAPDVPSVLLELGYLSNRRDVRQLSDDDWRSQAAEAVAKAIAAYFRVPDTR